MSGAVNAVVGDFLSRGGVLDWLWRALGRGGGADSLLICGGLGGIHGGLGPFVSDLLCQPGTVFFRLGFVPGC